MKRKVATCCLLLAVGIGSVAASQQPGLVEGVKVTLFDSNQSAIRQEFTNTAGDWQFADVPAGAYTVELEKERHRLTPAKFEASVGPDKVGLVSFITTQATTPAVFQLTDTLAPPGGVAKMPLVFLANGAEVTIAGFDIEYENAKLGAPSFTVINLPEGVTATPFVVSPTKTRFLLSGFGTGNWNAGVIGTVNFPVLAGNAVGTSSLVKVLFPREATAGVEVSNATGEQFRAEALPGTIHFGVAGDYNLNGKVDIGDVQLAIRIFLGLNPFDKLIHDRNGNGNNDVGDVELIIQLYMGSLQSASLSKLEVEVLRRRSKPVQVDFKWKKKPVSALGFYVSSNGQPVQVELVSPRPDLRFYKNIVGNRTRVLVFSATVDPFLKLDPFLKFTPLSGNKLQFEELEGALVGAQTVRLKYSKGVISP